jgi:hypothetical protein
MSAPVKFSIEIVNFFPSWICTYIEVDLLLLSRVTGLDEFSRLGRIFYLSSFLFTKVGRILGLLLSHKKLGIYMHKKIIWATFWVIFLQDHLVTLLLNAKSLLQKNMFFSKCRN